MPVPGADVEAPEVEMSSLRMVVLTDFIWVWFLPKCHVADIPMRQEAMR